MEYSWVALPVQRCQVRHYTLILSATHFLLSEDLDERIGNINDYFTFSLYSNVCRSLFECHKLLFSFLLCVRILMNDNKIDMVSIPVLVFWKLTKFFFYRMSGGTLFLVVDSHLISYPTLPQNGCLIGPGLMCSH